MGTMALIWKLQFRCRNTILLLQALYPFHESYIFSASSGTKMCMTWLKWNLSLFFDGSRCFDLLSAVDLRFPRTEILWQQKSRLAPPHERFLLLAFFPSSPCFCAKKFFLPFHFATLT